MHAQRAVQSEHKDRVRITRDMEQFDALFADETDAVIWNRSLPMSVKDALQHLPAHDVSNGRFCIPTDEARGCVYEIFREWSFEAAEATHWLAADVAMLARQMARTLSMSQILLRIELIHDDACRKFHRDSVEARLICTYNGPGTEFGLTDDSGQPKKIQTVPTGSPILLKGKLWPGVGDRPLLMHRSPPIENTGASRLVVVLNEAPPDAQ